MVCTVPQMRWRSGSATLTECSSAMNFPPFCVIWCAICLHFSKSLLFVMVSRRRYLTPDLYVFHNAHSLLHLGGLEFKQRLTTSADAFAAATKRCPSSRRAVSLMQTPTTMPTVSSDTLLIIRYFAAAAMPVGRLECTCGVGLFGHEDACCTLC